MPGPSLAPFLAAGGAFALVLSTLFIKITPGATSGTSTIAWSRSGVVALAIGLAFDGRRAPLLGPRGQPGVRRLEPPTALPAVAAAGPPEGVHVPGPSFRPLLAAMASARCCSASCSTPRSSPAGILMIVIGLLGWLNDARKEYRQVERADVTGHLENIPAPRFPTGTLIVFAVLFVGSRAGRGRGVPAAQRHVGGAPVERTSPCAALRRGRPGPGRVGRGPRAPAGSACGEPGLLGGGGGGAAVVLKIAASGVAYDTTSLEAPANTPFQIVFTNNDAGIPHNVSIHRDQPDGAEVWKGEIFSGVDSRTYDVPALPAGTYGFVCTVHPNMTGTLTVK